MSDQKIFKFRGEMMGDPAVKEATYADLLDVPENRVGEIINGELHTMPRPSFRHSHVVSVLVNELGMPYRRGKGVSINQKNKEFKEILSRIKI